MSSMGPNKTSEYLGIFHKTLSVALAKPETDPYSATLEAAHASGLHEYVTRIDASITNRRTEIDKLLAIATAPPPNAEGDPMSGLTPFEAAAPLLREQAKAYSRRAIAILITEIGLIGLAIWVVIIPSKAFPHPEDPGQPPNTFPRLALLVAIGLMIVSALSGAVYLT
jgi:hypothetical protein